MINRTSRDMSIERFVRSLSLGCRGGWRAWVPDQAVACISLCGNKDSYWWKLVIAEVGQYMETKFEFGTTRAPYFDIL